MAERLDESLRAALADLAKWLDTASFRASTMRWLSRAAAVCCSCGMRGSAIDLDITFGGLAFQQSAVERGAVHAVAT